MPPSKSLVGNRYGKLVVERKSDERIGGRISWICRCDCGNTTAVTTSSLNTKNGTRSCGCLSYDLNHARLCDLSGLKFGRWTVLERTNIIVGTAHKYKCVCECGNESLVSSCLLLSGHSKSCGCLQKENARNNLEDLAGRKFNRLTVIEFSGIRNRMRMWKCVCECGKETIVPTAQLKNDGIKSCGCLLEESRHKVFLTHGLSRTIEYRRTLWKKRREKSKINDTKWTIEMEACLREFFTECVVCGSQEKLAVDHVMPLDMGYGLEPGNAVILCKICNSSKHTRLPGNLPKSMPADAGEKILKAAQDFKDYWESLNIT